MLLIQESSSGSLSISLKSEIFGSGECEVIDKLGESEVIDNLGESEVIDRAGETLLSERDSLFSIWLDKSSETGAFMSILSVALMAHLGAHKVSQKEDRVFVL